MLQAPVFECFSFDPFPFQQDGLATAEVDIGGREVFQALVVSAMIVMADEGVDLSFEIAGQIIVLQQNAVLQGLMPTLDLALGLRMISCAADVFHARVPHPVGELAGDIA